MTVAKQFTIINNYVKLRISNINHWMGSHLFQTSGTLIFVRNARSVVDSSNCDRHSEMTEISNLLFTGWVVSQGVFFD